MFFKVIKKISKAIVYLLPLISAALLFYFDISIDDKEASKLINIDIITLTLAITLFIRFSQIEDELTENTHEYKKLINDKIVSKLTEDQKEEFGNCFIVNLKNSNNIIAKIIGNIFQLIIENKPEFTKKDIFDSISVRIKSVFNKTISLCHNISKTSHTLIKLCLFSIICYLICQMIRVLNFDLLFINLILKLLFVGFNIAIVLHLIFLLFYIISKYTRKANRDLNILKKLLSYKKRIE